MENSELDTHSIIHPTPSSSHTQHATRSSHIAHLLEGGDTIIYAIVGACFLLGALFALGYSFFDFYTRITETLSNTPGDHGTIATAVIQFISDLLLVLIIMEVLGTVTHYLKAQETSLRPFLFIGIVSATRSILSIGARLSIAGAIQPGDFINAMIEISVSAFIVLALGITLKLLAREID
jgi:uncharacterized membrane protein (DUF373 family)